MRAYAGADLPSATTQTDYAYDALGRLASVESFKLGGGKPSTRGQLTATTTTATLSTSSALATPAITSTTT